MDCVLLAGGSRFGGNLHAYTQGRPRAFVDMGGKTMIERIVAALQGSQSVDDVTIVGLENADLKGLTFDKPVTCFSDNGSMVKNALAGLTYLGSRRPNVMTALICSIDIPHITSAAIDDFVAACQPFDYLFYQSYVSAATLESEYPTATPIWEEWKAEGLLYSGDLFLVNMRILGTEPDLWEAFERRAWGRYPQFAAEITKQFGAEWWQRLAADKTNDEEEFLTISRLLGGDKTMKNVFTSHAGLALDADNPDYVEILRKKYDKG